MRKGISTFLVSVSIGALLVSLAAIRFAEFRTGSDAQDDLVEAPHRSEAAATRSILLPRLEPSERPVHFAALPPGDAGAAFSSDRVPQGPARDAAPSAAGPAQVLARLPAADLAAFTTAIAAYKSGDLARGDLSARGISEPLLRTALEWIALRRSPREAGFERLQAFASEHPDWPGVPWLQKRSEEALLGDRKPSSLVKAYFAGSRPQTPAGKLALAGALIEEGDTAEAQRLVRSVWREDDVNAWLEAKIRTDYGKLLDREDHKYRADRLLYVSGQSATAMRAANLSGPDVLALAKARASVLAEAPSERLMSAVPPALRTDPGYIFSRVQVLRRAGKIGEAADLLLSAPRDPARIINGDEWWVERRLVARKVLDLGDARKAYRICADHSAATDPMKIEAEFHAGWIALRFLNDPALAGAHFTKAAEVAETPMSRARVAYWRGRAAEAAAGDGTSAEARGFYEEAAGHPSTFYGQLARAKLGVTTLPIRSIDDVARGDERAEAVRVIEIFYALDEKDLAEPLVMESARHLGAARQVAALAEIVATRREARLSLAVGKLASRRGFALDALAFPVYGIPSFTPLENSAPVSVVYSIARQESAFNAKAVSPAGAKGLMQMMTATARRTAQRASVAFDEARLLADPAFNAQLAAAHLGDLLAEQRGSYILAFAAYNAGARRVKEWVEAYGDPRKPDVDPIDWIERIPFTETRNYVQRVTENLQIYRVRFGEAQASPFDRLLRVEAKL